MARLFCCSRVVLAGRYAAPKEAAADVARARPGWKEAYVRDLGLAAK
jgi:hypothetical protein